LPRQISRQGTWKQQPPRRTVFPGWPLPVNSRGNPPHGHIQVGRPGTAPCRPVREVEPSSEGPQPSVAAAVDMSERRQVDRAEPHAELQPGALPARALEVVARWAADHPPVALPVVSLQRFPVVEAAVLERRGERVGSPRRWQGAVEPPAGLLPSPQGGPAPRSRNLYRTGSFPRLPCHSSGTPWPPPSF